MDLFVGSAILGGVISLLLFSNSQRLSSHTLETNVDILKKYYINIPDGYRMVKNHTEIIDWISIHDHHPDLVKRMNPKDLAEMKEKLHRHNVTVVNLRNYLRDKQAI